MSAMAYVISQEQKIPVDSGASHSNTSKTLSYAVDQNKNKQDWALCGEVEGKFQFIIVADSHGKCKGHGDLFIKKFNAINWSEYLQNPDWTTNLERECENVKNIGKTTFAGTTFTCIKIFDDRFEASWIGDSAAKIIAYGKGEEPSKSYIMWKTKEHDARNLEDINVLEEYYKQGGPNSHYNYQKSFEWDIQAINPTTIGNIKSFKFEMLPDYGDLVLSRKDATNMTRCLGHGGLFNSALGFQSEIIPRVEDEKYKIIAATDGFWQVMSEQDEQTINASLENGAHHLATIARERWNQSWDHSPPAPHKPAKGITIPKWNHDDVGVAVWHNFQK